MNHISHISHILVEEIDFEFGHFRTFQTSVTFTLINDHGSSHTAYRRVSIIDLKPSAGRTD